MFYRFENANIHKTFSSASDPRSVIVALNRIRYSLNGEKTETLVRPKSKPKEKTEKPSLYVVILHNDAFTPRAFVVEVLKRCFQKHDGEAQMLMQTAHKTGQAVVGAFTREIAEVKAAKANDFAAERGHVLLFSVEKQ